MDTGLAFRESGHPAVLSLPSKLLLRGMQVIEGGSILAGIAQGISLFQPILAMVSHTSDRRVPQQHS